MDKEYRCQALSVRGTRCRNKARYYRINPDDGLEYLTCKQHYRQEWFRPCGQGQKPVNLEDQW